MGAEIPGTGTRTETVQLCRVCALLSDVFDSTWRVLKYIVVGWDYEK